MQESCGEFKITLVELHSDRRWSLYPRILVIGLVGCSDTRTEDHS
jgi:hypothetical protein